MPKTIRFSKSGGKVDTAAVAAQFGQAVRTLPNGNYSMTIRREHKHRTFPQNKLLWMWLACILKEHGNEVTEELKTDLYNQYCKKFLSYTSFLFGKAEECNRTSSQLNTKEFGEFLDRIQADAASEYGIILPSPQDQYFAEFEEEYGRYVQ